MDAKIELKLGLILCLSFLHIVTSQQIAPGQLKSKVDEIAKAYAEGYKAALTAMRARSMVARNAAQKRPINPKSFIPKPLAAKPQILPQLNSPYNFPSRQITVNGVEKSGIPRPQFQNQFARPAVPGAQAHTVVERSAAPPPLLGKFMQQQTGRLAAQQLQQRSNVQPPVAKLNNAARHRNVYLDSMGGDPYGGASGILSRQNIHLNRHRRSLGYQPLPGARRSRMPYLGQDLDKLGIVRAVPSISSPDSSKSNGLPSFSKVPVSHIEIAKLTSPSGESPNQFAAEKRSYVMPAQQQQQQREQFNALSNQNYQQRSYIPAAPLQAQQQPQIAQNNKRDMIAKLNHAAYHRNVYLDSMSGDPYGGSSGVLSRQHFLLSKHKRRMAENDF